MDDTIIKTASQVRNEGTFHPGTNDDGTTKKTLFDISISLHNNPTGDDDSTEDSGSGDDAQNRYERVIGDFVDAVCEQTNKQHRLGRVSVFRDGALKGGADIVWQASGRPGSALSGFGIRGRHIYMYDTFGDIDIADEPPPENSEPDIRYLGYTLGHEWGHYVYGLFDEHSGDSESTTENSEEYQALATDGIVGDVDLDDDGTIEADEMGLALPQTIMNDISQASVSGTYQYRWLNHSTSILDGSDTTGSTLVDTDLDKTVQGRLYRKSSWDVLVQGSTEDPKEWSLEIDYPGRTVYTDLTTPTATSGYEVGLYGTRTECRRELEIVWHGVSTTASRLTGHSDDVNSVAFSPDGTKLATGSNDNDIRIWDLSVASPTNRRFTGHTSDVNSVSFSPDGTKLASASDDFSIRLWDVERRRQIHELRGHGHRVLSVSFSPDGTKLASGSENNDIRI